MSTPPMTSSMTGVTSYGVHLPIWRLRRAEIGTVLESGGGAGTRSVASYDEDSTSMGVAAGLAALRDAREPGGLLFATATPAYADKTNAAIVHAALALDPSVPAYDTGGAARSAMAALGAAADAAAGGRPALAVLSDVRTGLPGSADERDGGDGAAAVLFGSGDAVLAELVGRGSASAEFLDRWRVPGELFSRVWEERFAEGPYVQLALDAADAALKHSGLAMADVDRVGIAGLHRRAVRGVRAALPGEPVLIDDFVGAIGATGSAQPGILLSAALDVAEPGEIILLIQLADGADAMVFRTTEALPETRERRTVPTVAELAAGGRSVAYPRFLTWRGFLRRDTPRRPDLDRPAAPPSARNAQWKFGLSGSRCTYCGSRHLPAARVCRQCRRVDRMARERVAGEFGTIASYQADLLAYTLDPPLISAAVDFSGGGRLACEVTDADPAALRVGDTVEMTFRRLYTTADGVHNYFWKARPRGGAGPASEVW